MKTGERPDVPRAPVAAVAPATGPAPGDGGAARPEPHAPPGPDTRRPRLVRGARLHDDRVRGRRVLLLPERVVVPDLCALAVLERLDGREVDALVASVAAAFDAPAARVRADVHTLLASLDGLGALRWEDGGPRDGGPRAGRGRDG